MQKKRSIVIIDGSNFYYKLKDLKLQNLLNFDFTKFLKELTNKYQLINSTFYVGKIRKDTTKKSQKLHVQQQKLLSHLKKYSIQYKLGFLLKSDNTFHEKGVDVHIAIDILVAAYESICDSIFLISSDTDLIPAIKKAQEKNKKIIYVGFSHKVSTAMKVNCDTYKLLTQNTLRDYIC